MVSKLQLDKLNLDFEERKAFMTPQKSFSRLTLEELNIMTPKTESAEVVMTPKQSESHFQRFTQQQVSIKMKSISNKKK